MNVKIKIVLEMVLAQHLNLICIYAHVNQALRALIVKQT